MGITIHVVSPWHDRKVTALRVKFPQTGLGLARPGEVSTGECPLSPSVAAISPFKSGFSSGDSQGDCGKVSFA